MIKMILFSVLAFSSQVFAQNVTVQVVPAQPVIIDANFTVDKGNGDTMEIQGPWFMASMIIINSTTEEVNLEKQVLSITSPSGFGTSSVQPLNIGSTLPAGAALQLQGYYSLMGLTDLNGIEGDLGVMGTTVSGKPFQASAHFVTVH